MKKNGETETTFERTLYNLRTPKRQEIFITVAIVCHRYETRFFAKCFRHYSAFSKKRRCKRFRRNCIQILKKKSSVWDKKCLN